MKSLIIIPTYWTLSKVRTKQVFDHPIHITEGSVLERLLESIRKFKVKEDVIFPTPLHKKVMKKNEEIIEKFPELNIHLFNGLFYKKIKCILKESKMPTLFRQEINLKHYGGIRNIGLITGALWGAENLIHLDDDEVVVGKNYFSLALDGIGKKIDNKTLVAKTGYYIDEKGLCESSEYTPKWKTYWQKRKLMSYIYNFIKSKKRFHETSMAFGGNMVINKKLYMNVPFDPHIIRGEDMDLLLNAKHFGYKFMFDNKMIVRHLPPKHYMPYWLILRRDAERFIYQREKMKFFNFGLDSLHSYPKFFLDEDLEYKASVTTINYAKECLRKGMKDEFNQSLENILFFLKDAKLYAKKYAPLYFKFQKEWVKLMKFIGKKY